MACKGSGVRIPLPPRIKFLIKELFRRTSRSKITDLCERRPKRETPAGRQRSKTGALRFEVSSGAQNSSSVCRQAPFEITARKLQNGCTDWPEYADMKECCV